MGRTLLPTPLLRLLAPRPVAAQPTRLLRLPPEPLLPVAARPLNTGHSSQASTMLGVTATAPSTAPSAVVAPLTFAFARVRMLAKCCQSCENFYLLRKKSWLGTIKQCLY